MKHPLIYSHTLFLATHSLFSLSSSRKCPIPFLSHLLHATHSSHHPPFYPVPLCHSSGSFSLLTSLPFWLSHLVLVCHPFPDLTSHHHKLKVTDQPHTTHTRSGPQPREARLFQASTSTGNFKVEEIVNFDQSDLIPGGLMRSSVLRILLEL